jgi:hypothetical protein
MGTPRAARERETGNAVTPILSLLEEKGWVALRCLARLGLAGKGNPVVGISGKAEATRVSVSGLRGSAGLGVWLGCIGLSWVGRRRKSHPMISGKAETFII